MMSLTYLSRLSRRSLLAASFVLVGACAGRAPAVATAPTAPSQMAVQSAVLPAPSIFDLQDLWYSQNVPAARLASLEGGLLVVGFVDRSCNAACTTTLSAMAAIERETDAKVHFVLVSNEGGHGTPATLAAFAKAKRLRSTRYTLISSNSAGIASLVEALGHGSMNLGVAQLEATSVLSVLDYNGISVRQRGNGAIGALLESLTLLENMR